MTKQKNSEKRRERQRELLTGLLLEILVLSPIFIGVGIFAISKGNLVVISLGTFIMGLSGIMIIVRKEIPTATTRFRGTRAIIEGILLTLFFWGITIIVLIENWKIGR